MKKYICILISLFCLFPLLLTAKLKIVTTTQDLASIAELIGGKYIDVSFISKGYEDPHTIIAKPSFMMKAKKADLWIRNGLELEIAWEQLILEGARNSEIMLGNTGHLDVSSGIERLEVPVVLDRSMGDVHPQGNPHFLFDPFNGRMVAQKIHDKLCEMDYKNSESYSKNLSDFKRKIDEKMFGKELAEAVEPTNLWKAMNNGSLENYLQEKGIKVKAGGWYEKMHHLRGSKYISFHPHWSYFNNRFGLNVPIYLEPKPGVPPTPVHLNKVIETIKNQKIKLLVQAGWYSMSAADYLKEKTNIEVSALPTGVGANDNIKTYFDLFDELTDSLSKVLR